MTTVAPFPAAPDWSTGTYETTAEQLRPAAAVLVDRAAPEPGETVVDIGCGTGTATLLSALRGARAVGVDPAHRLLQVARDAAAQQGLGAAFLLGEAGALPVGDGEADVVLSSFGLIFVNDPAAAAAEIARVRAPRGRVVFTAWAPGNALDRAFASMVVALTSALAGHGVTAPSRFAWHDPDALTTLFAPLGLSARLEQHDLQMTNESVSVYFEECIATHPLWVSAAPLLAEIGESQAVRAKIIETLTHANEDPSAFRITSRYVVVSLDGIPPAQQLRALGDSVSLPGEQAYEDGRQTYSLGPWREQDRDEVIRFITSIQQREFGLEISADDQPDIHDVEKFYRATGGEFWVARHAGAVVGTIAASNLGGGLVALRKLFVADNHRGKGRGLALRLMDVLVTWADHTQVRDIYLGTTDEMHAAHRFYARQGFVQIERDELPASFPVMLVDSRFYRRPLIVSSKIERSTAETRLTPSPSAT